MVRFSPVMYAAAGEQSAAAQTATSSGVARRPAGTVAATLALSSSVGQRAWPAPSVSVGPGQIVFRRIRPPPGYGYRRPEPAELERDRPPETGATARDDRGLALEDALSQHRRP